MWYVNSLKRNVIKLNAIPTCLSPECPYSIRIRKCNFLSTFHYIKLKIIYETITNTFTSITDTILSIQAIFCDFFCTILNKDYIIILIEYIQIHRYTRNDIKIVGIYFYEQQTCELYLFHTVHDEYKVDQQLVRAKNYMYLQVCLNE